MVQVVFNKMNYNGCWQQFVYALEVIVRLKVHINMVLMGFLYNRYNHISTQDFIQDDGEKPSLLVLSVVDLNSQ